MEGKPLGTLVFKPEEVYKSVQNVAPDLIVHFGALYWRSIGGVGYPGIHVLENDTGPDDCNHAQFGSFILAAPNSPLQGEITGARCWTSHRRSWTWGDTRSRRRCRGGRWLLVDDWKNHRTESIRTTMRRSFASD